MPTIEDLKELETPETPLFLFDCTLVSGDVQRWSTHNVSVNDNRYSARILKHNMFELKSSPDEATDGISKLSLTLANADSFLSGVERVTGWKGAQLTVGFLFYDFLNNVPASDRQVVFRGLADPPVESTESYLRLSFTNRLTLQRILLPEVRIQKRCPWSFPTTPAQMTEAVDGGSAGTFSLFYQCGYSSGIPNGVGNLDAGQPFTSCDYSRTQCQQRGMFGQDNAGNITRRFGGIEFVPSSVLVRTYGDKSSHYSIPLDNQARYNDFVPLVYGTAWYMPPIVFARNDGNLTHMEVLLGAGEMTAVLTVMVNGVQVPAGVSGANMTATGWYNVVTLGTRTGAFNPDFSDSNGRPLGDPYGSMACLSVVVPNIISDGRSLPEVDVLIQGVKVSRFDPIGAYLDESFTNNSAWVMLDVLRRSGWTLDDVDLASFATIASRCDQLRATVDLNGSPTEIPGFQCNLVLMRRRSAADIVRGIRTAAGIYLSFNSNGLLQVRAEDTLATQQPGKPTGSNSQEQLNGGWPAYEFGDNSFSGILRGPNGQSTFRTSARSSADSPNFLTVEFQDQFNEYQQDSLSLVNLDDSLRSSQQIGADLTALGLPNFDQATRVMWLQLSKSVNGNMYIDFQTSVKSVDLRPGDLIAVTYSKEGWNRQLFRVTRIAPATNYRTAAITAQIHDDNWYTASGMTSGSTGRQADFSVGLPRPLLGSKLDTSGMPEFDISETDVAGTDGSVTVQLTAGFVQPVKAQATGSGIPLVSLDPEIDTTGGSLAGGQNLYYGVTALDATGAESALSFLVKAEIPAGTYTNQVTLQNLSFSSSSNGFNVYRGNTPQQLLQLATATPIQPSFTDAGIKATFVGPPDVNYDHATFYWRIELQPEEQVDIHSPTSLGNGTLQMLANDYAGKVVRITGGLGTGQESNIVGNTATTISIAIPWSIQPDTTSVFVVADSTWQFGATGATSPISFDIPNRAGATVHVSGRSANVLNKECPYTLCTLTRWKIDGSGDGDVPPAPVFGLSAIGQGTIEMEGVGFSSYTNTSSIGAGTLTVSYWNELNTPSPFTLATDVDTSTGAITLSAGTGVQSGDLIQIDAEVMSAQSPATNATSIALVRGTYGTASGAHTSGTAVYFLERKTFVMPFATDFFGSPASGDYAYPVLLSDVRIAAAELFMTNNIGPGPVTQQAYTNTSDLGIRTLSGGQLSIQIEGMLAIQTNAAPPLSVDTARSVRDVSATVGMAPTGTPIQLQVTQNGQPFCALTIAIGSTVSNTVDGFSLGPLTANALIGLDILAVTQTTDTIPGSDLTVTIRL